MEKDWKQISKGIKEMKKQAEELKTGATGFPAMQKNLSRILASIRMLELNVSDAVDLIHEGKSS